jgi:hypothetical protein
MLVLYFLCVDIALELFAGVVQAGHAVKREVLDTNVPQKPNAALL